MALYCSAEAHYSVRRAAEVLGIGGAQRPRDPDRRAPPDGRDARARDAIDADRRDGVVPVAVVATAGTTLTGAVDDIDGARRRLRRRDVWLHVDGAYGLPAASTALAGHLLRRPRPRRLGHRRRPQVAVRAEGLQRAADPRPRCARARVLPRRELHPARRAARTPVDRTLEYSRPLSALKLWLAFRVHGADAIRAAIERNLRQARLLAEPDPRGPALELLVEPQLSAVCFRHLPPAGGDPDAHNAALAPRDHRRRPDPARARPTVDGIPCLRACIVNHRTSEDDVRAILEVVGDLATASATA